MARAIWSGSISFGLVNIPVKLYSAVADKGLHFHQLHDRDGARIEQKRICPVDGEEVPYEHVVKGYELSPGRYIIVDAGELEAAAPKATRAIEIEDFVPLSQIDPVHFDHTYYLAPDRSAAKPYALLLAALRETGRVGIARLVLRTKQYLAALRPYGPALALSTLYFADEILSPERLDELPAPERAPDPRELQMAERLVETLSHDFDPGKYQDDHRARLLAIIEQKAHGEEIHVEPAHAPARTMDLKAALEASLARARKKGAPAARRSRPGVH
ncbi:MAG: non-homologous end joining protein Ku [Deltaproteobacteria bacterium]